MPTMTKPRSLYFSYRASRAVYCGVYPHRLATFTSSTAFPLKSESGTGFPSIEFSVKSYTDAAIALVDIRAIPSAAANRVLKITKHPSLLRILDAAPAGTEETPGPSGKSSAAMDTRHEVRPAPAPTQAKAALDGLAPHPLAPPTERAAPRQLRPPRVDD